MKKSIFLCMAALLMAGTSVQAQFFKKLTKKVTDKVESAVTDNISDKAANEADDALNNVWNMDLGKGMNMGKTVDPAKIPDTYSFDWKYTLTMALEDGKKMDMTYWLPDSGNYLGMQMGRMNGMSMVMDYENALYVLYINGTVRATELSDEFINADDPNGEYADIEYEKIDSKTILGYECQGYRAETSDYIIKMYVTNDAGVGFSRIYSNKNMPKGIDPNWLTEDSLLMEMTMEDKNDTSKSMTMTCTSIEEENHSLSK